MPRGCYLSTFVYLAQYRAAFPQQQGEPLTVVPDQFDGPHTIASVTWQGSWWGRDEYFGVFPLHYAVAEHPAREELRTRAEVALGRFARRQLRRGLISPVADVPARLTPQERRRIVATAASLLSGGGKIVELSCGSESIPFLFLRPAPGLIAVYDPSAGTATARCTASDAMAAVAAVAVRLGYRVSAYQGDSGRRANLFADSAYRKNP